MADNVQEQIADLKRLYAEAPACEYFDAVAALIWPVIYALEASHAERDKLAAELATTKAIIATHDLCHDLHGKVGRDEFEEGCRRETVKEFGSCGWAERIANLEADLANERAVRSRRELAVSRAIAKAKPYLHPGTNAGTHGVLSEMVEILEGTTRPATGTAEGE